MENWKILSANDEKAFVTDSSGKIPVIEERIHVGTKVIETGKVRISKKVLEEQYHEDIPVFKEEVIVERKPVNQYIEGNPPGIRLDGDTTIIPVLKEVIIKRLLLVEELYVTRKRTETTTTVNEVLRKEEITISRTDLSTPATPE